MANTFRSLLKSNVILGGAQAIQIALSLLRMKFVAMLLGPVGVGLLGAYSGLQNAAVTAAGLGMASSGVKQIANASEDASLLARVRFTLLAAQVVQGALALLVLATFSTQLSKLLTNSHDHALEVAVVGGAVLLSLLAGSQTALLQGLRRPVDVAKVTLVGGIAGTALGVAAVVLFGQAGLAVLVIVQPLAAAVSAGHFVRRLPSLPSLRMNLTAFWSQWRAMVALGLVFMVGAFSTATTMLFIRSLVAQQVDLIAAGYFAAAWGVSSQILNLLLSPLASDYYPRVASAVETADLEDLLNSQTQLVMCVGGPGLLILMVLSPWLLCILYSESFSAAATLLQWLSVGGIFKLASWPLGLILMAKGKGRAFLAAEIAWNVLYAALCLVGIQRFGLIVVGVGFLAAYLVYFLTLVVVVRRLQDVGYDRLTHKV